jgi:hypothetical protein
MEEHPATIERERVADEIWTPKRVWMTIAVCLAIVAVCAGVLTSV